MAVKESQRKKGSNNKRKLNSKGKVFVRRVVAGLLMVTALIVAAIPEDASGVASAHSTPAGFNLDYDGDGASGATWNSDLVGTDQDGMTIDFLDPPTDSNELKYSYQIVNVDGTWELQWKYQYYLTYMDHNWAGVVSDYNDSMRILNLDLATHIIAGYEYVSISDYNNYVSSKINTINWVLDIRPDTNGSTGTDYTKVQKYFPEKYEQLVNKYNEALATYRSNHPETPDWYPTTPEEFDILQIGSYSVFKGEDMADDYKKLYYCDNNPSRGDPNLSLAGCTLVKVSNLCISGGDTKFIAYNGDPTKDSDGKPNGYEQLPADSEIYIVAKGPSSAQSADLFDDNGFLYHGSNSIKAISNKAFYNTKLVDNIYVGEGIRYIGDEAFRNSFIKNVNFDSVTYIGNRVFQDCNSLATVDLGAFTTTIGREAFNRCNSLTSIIIPKDVRQIGFGAFADCPVLDTVDFSNNQGCTISDYAFYNCPYLRNITFSNDYAFALGKAVFAMPDGAGTSCLLTEFTFPAKLMQYVSPADGSTKPQVYPQESADGSFGAPIDCKMGDYMFANRYNLDRVVMPLDFGSGATMETIPVRTFHNCPNLGCLKMGDSTNANVIFEPTLFEDVLNPALYVYGPQTSSIKGPDGENYAYPRRSTWEAHSGFSPYVPYVYNDGTSDHYEVGVQPFRYELSVNDSDKTAEMIRCEFIEPQTEAKRLVVPGDVAGYSIKSMTPGCFDSIKPFIKELIIADNSIEDVGEGVFSGCENLDLVRLGNSVKTLGNQAFANNPKLEWVEIGPNIESVGEQCFYNCPVLTTVDWDTPGNYGTLSVIGVNAFNTGSPKLNFYGDMVDGYYPFDYAMGDNKINSNSVRVCYNETIPTNYTTCVKGPVNEETNTSPEPVSPVLKTYSALMDENTGLVTLIDYPRYMDLPLSIRTKYEAGNPPLNDAEYAQLNATLFLNVPEAIESIDIASFMENSSGNPNKKNYQVYVPNSPIDRAGLIKSTIYSDEYAKDASNVACVSKYEDKGGYYPGLFSGEMYDGVEITIQDGNADGEQLYKGNDWILAVALPGVTSIPDYCFDSCERLQSVIIGDNCDEIGEAAFQGCNDLTSIGTSNNPNFVFDNYILYSNKPDGTLELSTCLPSRGEDRTSEQIWVNSDNDPNLRRVSSINKGAFSTCENITKVDLNDVTVDSIPEKAFENCNKLTEVILPDTVRNIRADAFNTGSKTLDITIPCDSQISDTAFNKNDTVTIHTYRECDMTAHYDPVGYDSIYIKYIDELKSFYITYLNDDLTVFQKIEVPAGYSGSYPDTNPMPRLATHNGYKFNSWTFDNPLGIRNVTENRQALATFVPPSSPSQNTPSQNTPSQNTPGNNNNNNNNNGNNNSSSQNSASRNSASNAKFTVTVENGAGSGSYEAGKVVTITAYAPADGKIFDTWTTSNTDIGFADATKTSTTFVMPNHSVKVTATYKNNGSTTNNNTGGNNSASNNGTGNNGGTGNNNGGNNNGNGNRGGDGTTDVRVTSDAIDNNNKNLASATVAGSTDNFVVKVTDSAQASAQVEEALKARYGNDLSAIKYVAFDISLYDATGTYLIENSNDLAVTITLPIPDDLMAYAGNNKAAAVINGQLDDKTVKFTTIDGVPCMTFTATHFSPYTIYVDTNNLLAGAMDLTPKTGIDIAPKWFLSGGLAMLGITLFLWKDKKKYKLS